MAASWDANRVNAAGHVSDTCCKLQKTSISSCRVCFRRENYKCRRAPRVRQPSNHGVSGFDFPNRHRGKSRKSVGKETHNGERDERRDIPSSHRKAPGADHETGVLLYTPAIWQSADTPESAFRAPAARVRAVLCQGRHAGQETATSAGDRPADP